MAEPSGDLEEANRPGQGEPEAGEEDAQHYDQPEAGPRSHPGPGGDLCCQHEADGTGQRNWCGREQEQGGLMVRRE